MPVTSNRCLLYLSRKPPAYESAFVQRISRSLDGMIREMENPVSDREREPTLGDQALQRDVVWVAHEWLTSCVQ